MRTADSITGRLAVQPVLEALKHDGDLGSVRYGADGHLFYGKVASVRSPITLERTDVASIASAFVEAVNDDLDTCRELRRTPETPVEAGTPAPRRIAREAGPQPSHRRT